MLTIYGIGCPKKCHSPLMGEHVVCTMYMVAEINFNRVFMLKMSTLSAHAMWHSVASVVQQTKENVRREKKNK